MNKRRTSIIWSLPKEDFQTVCSRCGTLADILRHFGLHTGAGNYKTLKKRIEEEGIDISHIQLGLHANRGRPSRTNNAFPLDKIFIKNSTHGIGNQRMVKRLVKEGIWTDENLVCSRCGTGKNWQGQPLTLQLDHINGISNDNRIENLRLLCPNCHSQTKTWGTKNQKAKEKKTYRCINCGARVSAASVLRCVDCQIKKQGTKIKWPPVQILMKTVGEVGWLNTAKQLGVSDNAVRNHLKKRGIDITEYKTW